MNTTFRYGLMVFLSTSFSLGCATNEASGNLRKVQSSQKSCERDANIVVNILGNGRTGPFYVESELGSEPKELTKRGGSYATVSASADSTVWKNGWLGEAPDTALVEKWYTERVSLAGCITGDLSKELNLQKVNSDLDVLEKERFNPSHPYPTVLHVSRPVFDKSGTVALLFLSEQKRGLGGLTQLILLKFDGMNWKRVGTKILSAS